MYSSRILSIFTHRRNIGFIVRQSGPNVVKNYKTPADITRFIEKSARSHSENKEVDYEGCSNLIEDMLERINHFTVEEVRTVAHSINEIFQKEKKLKWYEEISDFTLKRSVMMPFCFLCPLINSKCGHLSKSGVSKMGMKDSRFYNKVMKVVEDRMEEANSIDLGTIANTLVLLKNENIKLETSLRENILKKLSKMCTEERIISEMSAANSVLILYSFSKLNYLDKSSFKSLLELIGKIDREDFQPHLIPLVLHVFSVFNMREHESLGMVLEHIVKDAHKLSIINLANCLNSLARMRMRNYKVIKELVRNLKKLLESIRVRELGEFGKLIELANVMWSLSKLKFKDEEFMRRCVDKTLEYEEIDPMSYAQIFECLKTYEMRREGNRYVVKKVVDVMEHLLRKYVKIMKESPTQIITQVAWCCYVLNFDKYEVIKDSLKELSRRELNAVEKKYVDVLSEKFLE